MPLRVGNYETVSSGRPKQPERRAIVGAASHHRLKASFSDADTVTVSNGADDLYEELRQRVVARTGQARVPDLVTRAVDSALADSANERAWELVKLAADLRAAREPGRALQVLDAAWLLAPEPRVEGAIFTVAVAIHCDEARFDAAETLVREQEDRFTSAGFVADAKFAMAAARVFAALYEASADARHAAERDRFIAIAAESDEAIVVRG